MIEIKADFLPGSREEITAFHKEKFFPAKPMNLKKKILIIDDDVKLNQLLKEYLGRFGFEVEAQTHPDEALKALGKIKPDLIILDIMLPGKDGFETCKEIRKEHSLPIIMLTARGEVTDRIVGLELGADDYLPKPFEPRELVARIQTVLRRGRQEHLHEALKIGNLYIDFKKLKFLKNEIQVELTTMEFELLKAFIQNRGQVLSRDQLIDKLKGLDWNTFDRTIDVLVSRLRQKIENNPKEPLYIKTVWGAGYQFTELE
jgi:DNA-binding response OmpR family regulator